MSNSKETNVVSLTEGKIKALDGAPLLSAKDLINEGITRQKSEQTILGLFNKGILFVHDIGGETGKLKLTRRDSAIIRIYVYERLKTRANKKEIGKAIGEVCGHDDEFILKKLQAKMPEETIREELLKECRQRLPERG